MKNIAVTKWVLQRVSAVILLPLLLWFLFIFLKLVKQDYQNIVLFFQDDIKFIITLIFLIISFFHMKIGISEIFEDYIQNSRYKSVANLLMTAFATVLPLLTIVSLFFIIK